jgi:hypothetical protein
MRSWGGRESGRRGVAQYSWAVRCHFLQPLSLNSVDVGELESSSEGYFARFAIERNRLRSLIWGYHAQEADSAPFLQLAECLRKSFVPQISLHLQCYPSAWGRESFIHLFVQSALHMHFFAKWGHLAHHCQTNIASDPENFSL